MENPPYSDIGTWIKDRRRALKISQRQLADRAGYSVETIRKLEQNKYAPSEECIERVANVLQIAGIDTKHFRALALTTSRFEETEELEKTEAVESLAQPTQTSMPIEPTKSVPLLRSCSSTS